MQKRLVPSLLAAALTLSAVACSSSSTPTPRSAPAPSDSSKTQEVTAVSFKFTPTTMNFGVGDTVTFNLKSTDIPHNFMAAPLGLSLSVDGGKIATQTVMLKKAGSYKAVCTLPGHEGAGMTATINVK